MRFEKNNPYMNRTGRPKGARNKLAQRVFDDIFRHWNEPATAGGELCKGQVALELLYRERPGDYLKFTASVLAKEKEFVSENAVNHLSDDEVARMIATLRERQQRALELEKAPEPKLLNGH